MYKRQLSGILREDKVMIEQLISYRNAGMIQQIRTYGELLKEEYREDGIFVQAYVPAGMSRMFLKG